MFPVFSSREVTLGQMRKIDIHFIIYPPRHAFAYSAKGTFRWFCTIGMLRLWHFTAPWFPTACSSYRAATQVKFQCLLQNTVQCGSIVIVVSMVTATCLLKVNVNS